MTTDIKDENANNQQTSGLTEHVTNQLNPVAAIVGEAVSQPTEDELREQALRQRLSETLITYDTVVEPEQYALSVDDVGFFSLRDIHGVKAKQKNGKTTALKVCAAALMCGQQFRVKAELTAPKVLWLDTEQNRSDVKLVSTDIMQMTGCSGDYIRQFLHVHALRCCDYEELYPLMLQAIRDFMPQVIIVDGIVEFVASFNDEAIAKKLIHDLQVISQDYCCAVVCVLHTNKADEDHNMRGHLGTMLAQKAGTVLECRKQGGIISVTCTESRHAEVPTWSICFDQQSNIVDADQQREQWLEQRKADLQQKRREENERKQNERLDYAVGIINSNGGSMSRKELTEQLCQRFDIERTTASKFIKSQVEDAQTLFEDKTTKMVTLSPELSLTF